MAEDNALIRWNNIEYLVGKTKEYIDNNVGAASISTTDGRTILKLFRLMESQHLIQLLYLLPHLIRTITHLQILSV